MRSYCPFPSGTDLGEQVSEPVPCSDGLAGEVIFEPGLHVESSGLSPETVSAPARIHDAGGFSREASRRRFWLIRRAYSPSDACPAFGQVSDLERLGGLGDRHGHSDGS